MHDLIAATHNRAKRRELVALLRPLGGVRVRSLDDFPALEPPEEVGETFESNAILKALHVAEQTGCLALADDSGLSVDALGGAPGVYSARFAGPRATDAANNRKLLKLLKGLAPAKRRARFVCCVAIAEPCGLLTLVRGECVGRIAEWESGPNGFGYDPLFYVPSLAKTFGQAGDRAKHRLSHRSRAMRKARTYLKRYLPTRQIPEGGLG